MNITFWGLLIPFLGTALGSGCVFFMKRGMNDTVQRVLLGFAAGYLLGFGFAQLIGQSVFGSSIDMDPKVAPIVAGLIALVTIAGSLPAIRMVLRLRPAEVLHGG